LRYDKVPRAKIIADSRADVTETSFNGNDVFDRRLKLGTYLGIGLYVHWTFALLLAYLAYDVRDQGVVAMAYAVVVVLGVFSCVTLHEYGHALAARRFGIPTIDITLLPIGGVARLQRMPRIPSQELVVAVAGPAVNVVLAILIFGGLLIFAFDSLSGLFSPAADAELLTQPSLFGFAISMLAINVVLVLFNMIPAFPMDGGRVFRSLLAMVADYQKATYVASRVGLVCAVIMAVLAIFSGQVIPLLIALFIAYAGLAEARQVDMIESMRGLTIANSMIRNPPAISMDLPLAEIARTWQTLTVTELPVVSMTGTVTGVLRLSDLVRAIEGGVDPRTTAGELADHDIVAVHMHDDLTTVVAGASRRQRWVPVVDHFHHLIGTLDLDSLVERGRLVNVMGHPHIEPTPNFDAFS